MSPGWSRLTGAVSESTFGFRWDVWWG